MIYKITIMEKRHFCRAAGCLAMFIAVLAAVTSCREKPFSEDIGIESREVEIPPSGGVAVNGCRMFHWMWIVPEPVETVYTGDTISNDMCDYDVTGEWYTMRSGLDAGGNRVLFTIEAEPNATGEERGFTVHLRYFTNEDSFTVRQESE